jgi:hypothetical protein
MERRHPLQTHVWADDDIPDQITQDGEIVFHRRCVRCGRDFVQPADGTGWRALTWRFCESSFLRTASPSDG